MLTYEETLDSKNGWSRYQLLVYLWTMLGVIVHAGPISYMVFASMQPTVLPGSNTTYYQFDSFVKEWGLIGPRKAIAISLASTTMAGSSFGRMAVGPICDRFGRKSGIYASILIYTIVAFGIFSTTSLNTFGFLAFFLGVSGSALITAKHVLLTELFVQRWRLSFEFLGSPVGYLFMNALACFVSPNWRYQALYMLTPVPLYLLVTRCLIRESPKWLLERGKFRRALSNLEFIARFNNRQNFKYGIEDLQLISRKHAKGNLRDFFSDRRRLTYVAVVSFSHFTAAATYYSMLYGTGKLPGNFFVNYALMYTIRMISTSTVVGSEMFCMKMGRKTVHKTGLGLILLSTLSAFAISTASESAHLHAAKRAAGILTTGATGLLWTAIGAYNVELFPTLVRSQVTGITGTLGALGSIIGPQIVLLFDLWAPLPYALLAVLAMANIVMVQLLLPETKGKPLPDFESEKDEFLLKT